MRKYSEFRREMRRRKYRHHYQKIARGIYYGAGVVMVVAGMWLYTVIYMLAFAD